MQDTFSDELLDRLAALERRVELDQRLRPESPALEDVLDVVAHSLIANLDEAAHIVGVLLDQLVANRKCLHSTTPWQNARQ